MTNRNGKQDTRSAKPAAYPYLIVRVFAAFYQREAVQVRVGSPEVEVARGRCAVQHPMPLAVDGTMGESCRTLLIQGVQAAVRQLRFQICIVWEETRCTYVEADSIREHTEPPSGGVPPSELEFKPQHYEPVEGPATMCSDDSLGDKNRDDALANPPSEWGEPNERIVRLPINARRLHIAEKLTAPGHQDIDAVTAGIERVQLGLPGKYLVVTWLTRLTPSSYLDAIAHLVSFGKKSAARQFACDAIELLIAAGAKPEPAAKAYGPRFIDFGVPELIRASVRVTENGKSEEDHVSVIALGPFPSDIVGTELGDLFGNAREKRVIKDFFAFYGDSCIPAEWLEQDLSPKRPGSPAWVSRQVQSLADSYREQLDRVERPTVAPDADSSVENQIKMHEVTSVTTKSESEQLLNRPDPCSLEYWREFMLSFYPGITFHDYASAFRRPDPFRMTTEVEHTVSGYTVELDSTEFAIQDGAVFGWWLDEYHAYVVKELPGPVGVSGDNVEIISFGQSPTPSSAPGSDARWRDITQRLFVHSTLVTPVERAAYLRGGLDEVANLPDSNVWRRSSAQPPQPKTESPGLQWTQLLKRISDLFRSITSRKDK